VSAGRAHRRRAARWRWRAPDVELAAEDRAWVARMIAAHDDDEVTEEEFRRLGARWSIALSRLPEAERIEASLQVHDHAASALLGRRVRAIALNSQPETGPTSRSITG
jgi:hypothetical protein